MDKKKCNNPKETNWQLETILRQINVFGYYHFKTICLLSVLVIINSSFCVNYIFTAREIKYRCKYQECNNTFSINASISSSSAKCTRFLTHTNESMCNIEHYDLQKSVPCEEWVYEEVDTFVADFDLACQEWKRVLIGSIHCFGYLVGLLIVGPASDKLGRRLVIAFLTITGGILGVAKSFTTYYWMFVALEFLEAVLGDNYSPIYMMFVELVPMEYRLIFTSFLGFSSCISALIMTSTAWALPNWKTFLRIMYTPSILAVLLVYFIDESPRWLLSRGRKDEAVVILKKAAKFNNKFIEENLFNDLSAENHTNKYDTTKIMKDIFSSKILLIRFLICLVLWNSCIFISYGLVVNTASLPGNMYLNIGITVGLDILTSFTVFFVLSKFKRKKPIICGYILTALFCIIQPFVPKENAYLSIALYTLGKFTNSCVITALYLFTSELFPTYARNTMHAFCSSVGRIGSILGTQTPLLTTYWEGLPTLLFSGAALISFILTFFIPDTANEILPDNVQQAENVGNIKIEEKENNLIRFHIKK